MGTQEVPYGEQANSQPSPAAKRRGLARLIEEWQQSDLDLAQFCREKRLPPSNLRWWRWRLGIPVEKVPPPAVQTPATSLLKNDWIQFEIQAPQLDGAPFELRWPDGRTLAIPARFDPAALSRLLTLLERSPC